MLTKKQEKKMEKIAASLISVTISWVCEHSKISEHIARDGPIYTWSSCIINELEKSITTLAQCVLLGKYGHYNVYCPYNAITC